MDIRTFNRRAAIAILVCVVALALSACAGKESTRPPTATSPDVVSAKDAAPATDTPAADEAARASSDKPGLFGKMLHAVGIGDKKDASAETTQEVPLRIFTADNLNAGTSDNALGLVMKVYQLRSPHAFEQATFNDFLDDDTIAQALGDTMIKGRQMLLLPGHRYTSVQKFPADVHYLGFVALFRSPAAHRWRFLYDVSKSRSGGISLGVHACALSSTAGKLTTQLTTPADSLASVHCPKTGS